MFALSRRVGRLSLEGLLGSEGCDASSSDSAPWRRVLISKPKINGRKGVLLKWQLLATKPGQFGVFFFVLHILLFTIWWSSLAWPVYLTMCISILEVIVLVFWLQVVDCPARRGADVHSTVGQRIWEVPCQCLTVRTWNGSLVHHTIYAALKQCIYPLWWFLICTVLCLFNHKMRWMNKLTRKDNTCMGWNTKL